MTQVLHVSWRRRQTAGSRAVPLRFSRRRKQKRSALVALGEVQREIRLCEEQRFETYAWRPCASDDNTQRLTVAAAVIVKVCDLVLDLSAAVCLGFRDPDSAEASAQVCDLAFCL